MSPPDLRPQSAAICRLADARAACLSISISPSYEFALASAAVVAQMQGQRVQRIRVALGGIGTKPWRSVEAEQVLAGRDANEQNYRAAAEAALRDATPLHDNAFKVELAKRTLVRTLKIVTQVA